jgi:hypothetical protein
MKKPLVLCVAFCVSLSTSAAFARDRHGGSSHHSEGGTAGTKVNSPGTNSAGTALSTDDGESFGSSYTSLVVKEELKLRKMLRSTICRGC